MNLRARITRQSAPVARWRFTIVASGPNGALPHHETGRRLLQAGDMVILDFGIREMGGLSQRHHGDVRSGPAERFGSGKRFYRVVWEAQRAAIEAVRPGATCEAIDQAARSVIEKAGYGPQFLHRTGHGLGLQVHEPPYMVAGNTEILEEGMVFSIEPGIYLPGRFWGAA